MIFLLLMNEYDSTTLSELYNTYKIDMFKIANSILNDAHEAQDVIHTSIIKVNSNLHKINLNNKHETRGFILMITKNNAINVYNRRKKIAYLDNDCIQDFDEISINDVESNLLDYEHSQEIAAMIEKLNSKYAQVITLRYLHDYTTKEISYIMDCTETNTRVMLHRARVALKSILMEARDE